MIFDQCRIPEANVLGEVGEGFIQAMKILDGGRISIASLALGMAKGALETATQYAKEREQFGQPIARFQAIAFKLADMATSIEAADLLTLQACELKTQGKAVTRRARWPNTKRVKCVCAWRRRGANPGRLRLHEGLSRREILP